MCGERNVWGEGQVLMAKAAASLWTQPGSCPDSFMAKRTARLGGPGTAPGGPSSEQLQRGLRAVRLALGEVEVVDEDGEGLAKGRAVRVRLALLELGHEVGLQHVGGGVGGEVDHQRGEGVSCSRRGAVSEVIHSDVCVIFSQARKKWFLFHHFQAVKEIQQMDRSKKECSSEVPSNAPKVEEDLARRKN